MHAPLLSNMRTRVLLVLCATRLVCAVARRFFRSVMFILRAPRRLCVRAVVSPHR